MTVRDAALVLDAGTSALRALLVDAAGGVTPLASRPWPMFVPDDAPQFGRELNAADVAGQLSALFDAARPHAGRIAAVACAGQREGVVFEDAGGRAVLVSPNIDARASAEGIAIDAARGGEIYATTGHLPSLLLAPAKFAWLRVHRPQDAARVRRIVPFADWVAAGAAGADAAAACATLAAEIGLLDISTRAVAAPLLGTLGLDAGMIPPVVADGSVAGRCDAIGGAPVVLAGADTQCALAGMGAVRPGDTGVAAGWSAPAQRVAAAPVFDDAYRTWAGLHVAPGMWVSESNAGEMGRAWQWACDLLGASPAAAEALAAQSPPGARDVMAVLGARAMDAGAMSAGVGAVTFPLPLVMGAPDRADVLRATLEAVAFAVRANIEQLEEVTGGAVDHVAIGGGMSRSATFVRIVCDVLARPLDIARSPETSALGAAALALAATGVHDSLDAALGAMCRPARTLEPDTAASAAYDDCYGRWCAMADEFQSGKL